MALKSKPIELEPTEAMNAAPPMEQPTEEELAEVERQQRQQREAEMAPYVGFADANADRDELLSELLFEMTMMKLEG